MKTHQFWKGKLLDYFYSLGVKDKIDFSDLKGAKIINVGFHPDATEGGLAIDYEVQNTIKRIVFEYNELGIWKTWQGEVGNPTFLDKTKKKLQSFISHPSFMSEIEIIDKPRKNGFSFVEKHNKREVFFLSVSEIKVLSKAIQDFFTQTERDFDKLIPKLVGNAF